MIALDWDAILKIASFYISLFFSTTLLPNRSKNTILFFIATKAIAPDIQLSSIYSGKTWLKLLIRSEEKPTFSGRVGTNSSPTRLDWKKKKDRKDKSLWFFI